MLTVFVIILAALSALLVYLLYRTKVVYVRYEKTIKRFAELANISGSRSPVAIYNAVRTLIRDKTEEIKRVSEKLKYMENVLDNLGDALFITDAEGRVEFYKQIGQGTSEIPGPSRKEDERDNRQLLHR